MAKDKKGSGIQQAAGLIRYFDEESEDAIQISRGMIYFACISFSVTIYLATHGVLLWLADTFQPHDTNTLGKRRLGPGCRHQIIIFSSMLSLPPFLRLFLRPF